MLPVLTGEQFCSFVWRNSWKENALAHCHRSLHGEGEGTTNKRRLQCAAKPVPHRPSVENESVCKPQEGSFFPAFSASRRKSVYRKEIRHTVWLSSKFSHQFSTRTKRKSKRKSKNHFIDPSIFVAVPSIPCNLVKVIMCCILTIGVISMFCAKISLLSSSANICQAILPDLWVTWLSRCSIGFV